MATLPALAERRSGRPHSQLEGVSMRVRRARKTRSLVSSAGVNDRRHPGPSSPPRKNNGTARSEPDIHRGRESSRSLARRALGALARRAAAPEGLPPSSGPCERDDASQEAREDARPEGSALPASRGNHALKRFSPSANRWIARTLQQVVIDECGVKPTFALCLILVENDGGRDANIGAEEQACRLFDVHEEKLVVSGKMMKPR